MGDLRFYKNICSPNFPRAIFHVLQEKFVIKTIISGMASFTLISSWLLLNIILSDSSAKPLTGRSGDPGDTCHSDLECASWLYCDARTNQCSQYDNFHLCDKQMNCPPGFSCDPIYPLWLGESYCMPLY